MAGSLPAEKEPNEGEGVEKPVGSGTEKQANKGTAYKSAYMVSYSSQDSNSQDDTGSRKNTRKRTVLSKLGPVMIDAITRDERKGRPAPAEKGRDTA